MMQKIFGEFIAGRAAIGLLVLRVVIGAAMMLHGWGKIQQPMSWMDKPGKPSAIPDIVQALAALGEFGGGLGILLGFLTPLAALGVLGTMMGAWWIAHRGDPWINPGGKSFELASVYGVVALMLLFTGPGVHSLDAKLFGGVKRATLRFRR